MTPVTHITRRVAAILVLGVLATGCSKTELPYYDSADFTPRWTRTAPRRVAFDLLDQFGQRFSPAQLLGTVHVVSFIYTRCSVICPALVSNLKRVEDAVPRSNFRVVSFSVTPDLDPPAVLAAFGRERAIDPKRWSLVTGDKAQIYRLARDAYFADDDRLQGILADPNAVLHTEKLILVDADGRLRGVYDGTLPRDIDLVIADAEALLEERS